MSLISIESGEVSAASRLLDRLGAFFFLDFLKDKLTTFFILMFTFVTKVILFYPFIFCKIWYNYTTILKLINCVHKYGQL